jgi:5'-nucleotidase
MSKMKKNPLIYITNDDGPDTIGLKKLIKTVNRITNNYIVVVPESNRSGYGHSITISKPIRLNKINDNFYTCSGTPTDCVMLGLFHILNNVKPDLLISGINMGENLADDVTYSGTVCAALEGALRDIKSIALSKIIPKDKNFDDWSGIDKYLKEIILNIINNNTNNNHFFNINFPNISSKSILDIKVTNLSRRKPKGNFLIRKDSKNIPYFWLTTERYSSNIHKEDSDIWAINNNYISISPVNIGMSKIKDLFFYKEQFNKNK